MTEFPLKKMIMIKKYMTNEVQLWERISVWVKQKSMIIKLCLLIVCEFTVFIFVWLRYGQNERSLMPFNAFLWNRNTDEFFTHPHRTQIKQLNIHRLKNHCQHNYQNQNQKDHQTAEKSYSHSDVYSINTAVCANTHTAVAF